MAINVTHGHYCKYGESRRHEKHVHYIAVIACVNKPSPRFNFSQREKREREGEGGGRETR